MTQDETGGTVAATALRTAELLIERHRAQALDFARRQVQQLTDAGARQSASEWQEVVRAIEELLAKPTKR